jgi:hypothetical protein
MFRFERPDATTAAVAEGEAMIRLIVKLVVIDLALLVLCGAVILFGTLAVSYSVQFGLTAPAPGAPLGTGRLRAPTWR